MPKDDFIRSSDIPEHYIQIDRMVRLTDDGGEIHMGKIIGIGEHTIKVDFNHAMVNKTLHFKGAVLSIRKATLDEMVREHYLTSEDANWR